MPKVKGTDIEYDVKNEGIIHGDPVAQALQQLAKALVERDGDVGEIVVFVVRGCSDGVTADIMCRPELKANKAGFIDVMSVIQMMSSEQIRSGAQ